jgi:hypothetical protein
MSEQYTLYYLRQAEGGYYGDYHTSSQKGDGLGSFLGGIFRKIFPLFKSGAGAVRKEALSTGVNLLKDVISGRAMKDSVRARVLQAGTNLSEKAANKMQSMVGSGYKRRTRKRKRQSSSVTKRRKVRATKKTKSKRKRRVKRKKKRDIFDSI